jgi:hypothetical protein
VVKQWFLDRLLESLNDESIPENFKDFVKAQDMENENISKMIDANPRILFDVFDEHKVYIEILVDYKKPDVTFTYTVINDDTMYSNPSHYNNRIEAEKEAIEQAFQMLNNKL